MYRSTLHLLEELIKLNHKDLIYYLGLQASQGFDYNQSGFRYTVYYRIHSTELYILF